MDVSKVLFQYLYQRELMHFVSVQQKNLKPTKVWASGFKALMQNGWCPKWTAGGKQLLLRNRRQVGGAWNAPSHLQMIWGDGGQCSGLLGAGAGEEPVPRNSSPAASLNPAGHTRSCLTNHRPPTGFIIFYSNFLPTSWQGQAQQLTYQPETLG